jgi:hypothetical protein
MLNEQPQAVNLCVRVSSYAHPYLSFQRNSTLQHYDATEIIARAAENCACMFVIVKDPAKRPPLYVQIFIIRKSCSPPRGEQG